MSTPAPQPHEPNDAPPIPGGSNINLSGDAIIANTEKLPADQAAAVRWLFAYAKEKGIGYKDLEREVELSTTTLYRIFRGQYNAALDRVVERIETFKKLVEARGVSNHLDFVETSISRKIFSACDWALVSQSITFIYGVSQIGKTTALEEYQRRNNHGQTKLVRMPASAGVQLVMKELARACYVSPDSSFERLRERVFGAITSNNLVIIDELHQVFLSYQRGSAVKALEVIRELHDRTKCGLILCGTKRLRQELLLGQHQELLEQFRRRGIAEVVLPNKAPARDVLAIAKAFGLDAPDGEAVPIVEDILSASGLGKFTKFLQAGHRLASKQKERVTWAHFVRAHDILKKLSDGGAA